MPQQQKAKKALFTLSYLVSYELRRLLANPEIMGLIVGAHFDKFKGYFQKSFELLVADEKSQEVNDAMPYEDQRPKRVKFSTCFKDLAYALDLKLNDENFSTAGHPSQISQIDTSQHITPGESPRRVVPKSRPVSKRNQSCQRNQKAGRQMVIQENKTVQMIKANYVNSLDKLAPLKLSNFRSQTPKDSHSKSQRQVRKSQEGRQITNRSHVNPIELSSAQMEEMQKIISKYEVCKKNLSYIGTSQQSQEGAIKCEDESTQTRVENLIQAVRYKKNQVITSKFAANYKDDQRRSILRNSNRMAQRTCQDSKLAEKILQPVLGSQLT